MIGKSGVNPPLPRNCKRRGLVIATGENSRKAAAADEARSQETGPARTSEGKTMFVLSRRFTFASVCLFVLAGIAYTLPNTSIHGTVTDPSGAAVPNAKVELLETKNDHETLVATVMTNANGEYVFERTPASVSRLLVSAPGFRTVEQSISVEVDT